MKELEMAQIEKDGVTGCTCDEGHFEEGGRVEPCTCACADDHESEEELV